MEYIFQADQRIVLLKVNDRAFLMSHGAHVVFQPPNDVFHSGEGGETAELLEYIHGVDHHCCILRCKRDIGDAVVRIRVSVVLVLLDNDGRVIAQLVGAHHLNIGLNGASGDVFITAFVLAEGIRAGVNQVLQRSLPVSVEEAVVDGLVTDKGVLTRKHCQKLLLNPLLN